MDVRYADGSVVHAKIGHRDRAWDLALLVPQTGKWVDGLAASMANPLVETLEAPVALHPGRPVGRRGATSAGSSMRARRTAAAC